MHLSLPMGIETYLLDTGFSGTELIVLRKFFEQETYTLRSLALKTGRSTGVLDQAMKKLQRKGVVVRVLLNENPVYKLQSLESISRYIERSLKERREDMDRRHACFKSFMGTMKTENRLPDVEHFQGREGIEQIYHRILQQNVELLTTTRIMRETCPHWEGFFRGWNARRQMQRIFQRVLSQDTIHAAAAASRDDLCYRKTLLVLSQEKIFHAEKIIAGDCIAYIDLERESGCIIHFPELALAERGEFELLWKHEARREALMHLHQ